MEKNPPISKSLYHALCGIWYTVKEERNFRIELAVAFGVGVCAVVAPLTMGERSAMFLAVIAVIVVELINTAIENTVDTMTDEHSATAQRAKDSAAAAVLVCTIGAVVCGGIVAYRVSERIMGA